MAKTIWTTSRDKERLFSCLDELDRQTGNGASAHIQEFAAELSRAKVVDDPTKTPDNLITMRSKVSLKNMTTGREMDCSLVYPEEGDAKAYRISVLAPLGTAMLGHKVGDTFEVELPRGTTTFRVEALPYQPEAAGDVDL